MLEERAQAFKERGDAATERAQHLATKVQELSEKLLASEELRQQMEDLIEELRLVKHSKVHLRTTHCATDTLSVSDSIPKERNSIEYIGPPQASGWFLLLQAYP